MPATAEDIAYLLDQVVSMPFHASEQIPAVKQAFNDLVSRLKAVEKEVAELKKPLA